MKFFSKIIKKIKKRGRIKYILQHNPSHASNGIVELKVRIEKNNIDKLN